ncbi:unnamed protein product, partial [Meganyctiphanes norvegica]
KEKSKSKKSKKDKKDKSHSSSKKKSVKKDNEGYEDLGSHDLEDYAEANGISETEDMHPLQSRLLAQDSFIKMTYTSTAMEGVMSQVVISVSFSNLTAQTISNIKMNLPDSKVIKMIRTDPGSDTVVLPWNLIGGASQEGQFAFTADDVTIPHKLRGTLTYSLEDGSSKDLSIRLEFPVTMFLSGKTASRATFTDLLSSGQLTSRSSFTITECSQGFSEILKLLISDNVLAVVERVDQTASLYARSLHGHHICLLVKYQEPGRLTVDGKGTDGTLLSNLLDQSKTSLSQTQ